MMNARQVIVIILLVAVVIIAATVPAAAQCAMCKAALENSAEGQSASKDLNLGMLVLLIPPVAIFGGLFGMFYRFRNVQGRSDLNYKEPRDFDR